MDLVENIEFSVLVLIKIATLIFLAIYIIFAGVVIKQVKVMTETLEVGFEGPIRILAFVHFVFALVVLFLAIVIL